MCCCRRARLLPLGCKKPVSPQAGMCVQPFRWVAVVGCVLECSELKDSDATSEPVLLVNRVCLQR